MERSGRVRRRCLSARNPNVAIFVRQAMGMQFRTHLPVHVRVFIIGKQPGCQFECGRIGGAVQKSNPVNGPFARTFVRLGQLQRCARHGRAHLIFNCYSLSSSSSSSSSSSRASSNTFGTLPCKPALSRIDLYRCSIISEFCLRYSRAFSRPCPKRVPSTE